MFAADSLVLICYVLVQYGNNPVCAECMIYRADEYTLYLGRHVGRGVSYMNMIESELSFPMENNVNDFYRMSFTHTHTHTHTHLLL